MATLVKEQTTKSVGAEAEVVSVTIGERLRAVTVGGALAGAIVLVAALIRLYALGGRPLGEAEAARALLALQYARGQPADITRISPLLTNLNLLVFFLAGGGDFWARLVPALFGIGLVAVPVARFRRRLGVGAALAASALVAVSPTFLLFSRSVDPAVLSAVTSLLFIGAVFDFLESGERRDLLVAAGALGVALTAGPGTYTVLLFMLIFALGALLLRRYRGAAGSEPGSSGGLVQRGSILAPEVPQRSSALVSVLGQHIRALEPPHPGLVFGVAFVAAATGFLVNFGGIQAALNLFVEWLTSFSLTREYPIWYYIGTLVLYEPVILVFGLLGASVAIRRRDLFGRFLVTWFAGGLLLYTLVGRTEPSLVVPILLPLTLLAGWGVAWVFEFARIDELLRALLASAFVLALMVYAVLQLAFYAEMATRSINLFLALGAVVMAVVVAVVFASSRFGMAWQPATVARGVGISVLLLSLGLTLHMAWRLNFLHHEPMRELMVVEPTSVDVREMVGVLETVSQDRVGDTVSIPITVDGRLAPPVLWYLQDFTNVTVVHEVRQPPGTPVVIMPATGEMPPIGDQYVGQGFRLSYRWRPTGLTGGDLARWYFYREGPAVPMSELIVFVTR